MADNSSSSSSSSPFMSTNMVKSIFLRFPPDTLLRLKPADKEWRESFVSEHRKLSRPNFLRIENRKQLIINPHESTDPKELDQVIEGSLFKFCIESQGLLLTILQDDTEHFLIPKYAKLALWKPIPGEIIEIPKPQHLPMIYDSFGIGFSKTCKENVKLMTFECNPGGYGNEGDDYVDEVSLFDFNLKAWRMIRVAKTSWEAITWSSGVSFEGDMYWTAVKADRNYLLCFDFTLEKFKVSCVCPDGILSVNRKDRFSNVQLSLLHQNEVSKQIEIWVMTTSGEEASFTKYLTVRSHPDLPDLQQRPNLAHPVYFVLKRSIVILAEEFVNEELQEGKQILLYELNGRIRKRHLMVTLNSYDQLYCAHIYHPNIVPLPN